MYPPANAEPACFSDFHMRALYLSEHSCGWSNLFQKLIIGALPRCGCYAEPQILTQASFFLRQLMWWTNGPYDLITMGTVLLKSRS